MVAMLHPQLAADTTVIGVLPVCRVLLNSQFRQFPWVILVPDRIGLRDLTDLPQLDFMAVMEEVRAVHDALRAHIGADKMNVAAIGNVVPQLHIHIIARFTDDACWPKPVWGHAQPDPYADKGIARARELYEAMSAAGLDIRPPETFH
jgi:diadenosine tetraphosphate (Ap4A) HIT family hydrolase